MNGLYTLVLTVVLLAPAAGFAQSATDLLTQGIQAYEELEWETAITRLDEALKLGLQESSQVEAYKYLGFCYIETDQLSKAKKAFGTLLDLNPAYELDPNVWPPKYREVFDQVKADREQGGNAGTEKTAGSDAEVVQTPSDQPKSQKTVSIQINLDELKKWYLPIGGGVVGVVAVIILIGRSRRKHRQADQG